MSSASVKPAQELLDQLQGAQIVDSHVEDESGLHLAFADGRVLVIAGYFALSVLSAEVLH